MKKNNAILLVIGLAGVGAYFIFRKKQPIVQSLKVQPKPKELEELATTQTTRVKCKDGYEDVANGIVAPCIGHGGVATTISEIGSQIQANSNQVPVQEMPNFGRPLVMMNDRPMRYQNYVDVQKNTYFKPKAGAFFR